MSSRTGAWVNPDHETMLRDLWPKGVSCSQIAKRINAAYRDAGYSRNAIIGKVNRLGLEGRGHASAPHTRKDYREKPAVRAPAYASRVVRHAVGNALLPAEKADNLAPTADLLGLGAHMCKWPIGDPQREGFGFCGRDTEATYCAIHARRAFASPSLRTYVDARLLAPVPMRRRA